MAGPVEAQGIGCPPKTKKPAGIFSRPAFLLFVAMF
jgi:hypothetical protein